MSRAFLALLVLVVSCVAASAERRVALVFGADTYRNLRPLENAVNDARAIEETLRNLGFEVFSETDRDLRRMRRALEDFREDAAGADVALAFFAGHGVEITGENRLLPVDANAESIEQLEATSLPLEELTETLRATAPVALVLLDACRDDPFAGGSGLGRGAAPLNQRAAEVRPGFGRVGRADNLLFAFAAAPGMTAADGTAGNSPFTSAMTRYLGTDGIEIRSALTLVQQAVYDETKGAQLPYVESGLPTMFFAAQQGELPERERLLLAMADITPAIRSEIEAMAGARNMPLAPLYGALISAELASASPDERAQKLNEAASAFVRVRDELRNLSSADPEVTRLRLAAEAQLALGAFATARERLSEAADIDSNSREALKANFVERTLSEATTRYLSAGAAQADLKYSLAIADFEQAVALIDEADIGSLPQQAGDRRLASLYYLSQLQVTAGTLDAALVSQQRLVELVEARYHAEPGSLHLTDVAQAHNYMGDIRKTKGDLVEADASYMKSLALLEKAREREPQSYSVQRALGSTYDRLGDLEYARGRLTEAYYHHYESWKIARNFVQGSNEADRWRSLAITYGKLGHVLLDQDRLAEAESAYGENLRIARIIADANKGSAAAQRELAAILHALGDLHFRTGKLDAALQAHSEGLAIAEHLAAADIENLERQRDLSVSLGNVAHAHFRREDQDQALTYRLRSLEIAERLAAHDGESMLWQRDLSAGLIDLGDILTARGDAAAARTRLETSLAVARRMIEKEPGLEEAKRQVVVVLLRLSAAQRTVGDTQAALGSARQALSVIEPLAALDPANMARQREFAAAQEQLAEALRASGDAEQAADAFLRTAKLLEPLVAAAPANVDDRIRLFSAYRGAARHAEYRVFSLARAQSILAQLDAEKLLPAGYAEKLAETSNELAAAVAATGQ